MYGTSRNHAHRWAEVMEKSDHSVTLIDLCGHEKYLKTTLFGLTGLMPDYCMLVVGSNMGVQVMTREHISIACALNLPMFVAVTKVTILAFCIVVVLLDVCHKQSAIFDRKRLSLQNASHLLPPGGHLSREHSEDHPHCSGETAPCSWQDALSCEGPGRRADCSGLSVLGPYYSGVHSLQRHRTRYLCFWYFSCDDMEFSVWSLLNHCFAPLIELGLLLCRCGPVESLRGDRAALPCPLLRCGCRPRGHLRAHASRSLRHRWCVYYVLN